MNSAEILSIFNKFGLPEFISSSIAIGLFMIFKFNAFTLFSASNVELKLFTKEQRISNKIFNFILSNMALATLTCLIVIMYVEYNISLGDFNQVVYSVLFVISTLHACFAYITIETPRLNAIRNNKVFRVTSIVLLFCTFPYLSLMIAPITTETVLQQNGLSLKILFTMFIAANIFTPLYLLYFITINKMMVSKKSYYVDLPVTNTVATANPSQTEKWYLIHPIDKDHYLLSDKPDVHSADKVKLLPKNELSQHAVIVEFE